MGNPWGDSSRSRSSGGGAPCCHDNAAGSGATPREAPSDNSVPLAAHACHEAASATFYDDCGGCDAREGDEPHCTPLEGVAIQQRGRASPNEPVGEKKIASPELLHLLKMRRPQKGTRDAGREPRGRGAGWNRGHGQRCDGSQIAGKDSLPADRGPPGRRSPSECPLRVHEDPLPSSNSTHATRRERGKEVSQWIRWTAAPGAPEDRLPVALGLDKIAFSSSDDDEGSGDRRRLLEKSMTSATQVDAAKADTYAPSLSRTDGATASAPSHPESDAAPEGGVSEPAAIRRSTATTPTAGASAANEKADETVAKGARDPRRRSARLRQVSPDEGFGQPAVPQSRHHAQAACERPSSIASLVTPVRSRQGIVEQGERMNHSGDPTVRRGSQRATDTVSAEDWSETRGPPGGPQGSGGGPAERGENPLETGGEAALNGAAASAVLRSLADSPEHAVRRPGEPPRSCSAPADRSAPFPPARQSDTASVGRSPSQTPCPPPSGSLHPLAVGSASAASAQAAELAAFRLPPPSWTEGVLNGGCDAAQGALPSADDHRAMLGASLTFLSDSAQCLPMQAALAARGVARLVGDRILLTKAEDLETQEMNGGDADARDLALIKLPSGRYYSQRAFDATRGSYLAEQDIQLVRLRLRHVREQRQIRRAIANLLRSHREEMTAVEKRHREELEFIESRERRLLQTQDDEVRRLEEFQLQQNLSRALRILHRQQQRPVDPRRER
ncbi:hypothetical protein BESB_065970 [Besnoitia besnoiti]|uniref:Uncharacterized protein n=1 Tax=Besnoitia besnoiti TaxID=94643 RepID=A0A2A9MBG7_BESBE|nr:hypothetical protein BESB_065970 [Besnoitia besnoiti]PFH34564.1 hypothetical protein BESB_065970 [Besnoitia besnoiti]